MKNGEVYGKSMLQSDQNIGLKLHFHTPTSLQVALENFLRIFTTRYEYLKCLPRLGLYNDTKIIVIGHVDQNIFEFFQKKKVQNSWKIYFISRSKFSTETPFLTLQLHFKWPYKIFYTFSRHDMSI